MTGRAGLVVFDWDGTLLDSTAAIVRAAQVAAAAVDLPVPPAAQVRAGIGLGLAQGLARVLPDLDPTRAAGFRTAFERAHAQAASELFPGVVAMLERLRAEGWVLAIATGASRRILDRQLRDSCLFEMFDATICSDETFSKPHPQMLHTLMATLGALQGATRMVGDSVFDLQMAQAAGVAGLGVTWGAHPAERLAPLASLGLVETVAAIPEVLARSRQVRAAPPGRA